MMRCPFVSEGQQAAHPSELQRHHLWEPGQVAWPTLIGKVSTPAHVFRFPSFIEKICKICKICKMSVPMLPQVVANKARHPRSGGHHPRDLHRRPKLQAGQGVGCISFPHLLWESMTRVFFCGKVSNFLWPFKLSSPKGGFINKRPGLRMTD